MSDENQIIHDNLAKPRIGKNDMGEFHQHSLPDQIAAAKYLNSTDVATNKYIGMLFRTFSPPGTV